MSAYNWLRCEGICPSCGRKTCLLAQTHFASSHGGDESGRFHDHIFAVGDRMPWFSSDHHHFAEWPSREGASDQPGDEVEACYASCESCEAKLYVVVRFRDFRPIEVVQVGLEDRWPQEYGVYR